MLNDVKKSLEALADVDAKVYANLSRVYAQYYKRKDDHENFYQNSLSYLAYTPASELSNEEMREWSIKMGMSVLLGKNIYNITELVCVSLLLTAYYSLTKKSYNHLLVLTLNGYMTSSRTWVMAESQSLVML